MATRFEMVLHGQNQNALRAAGEEAIAEIERLEAQLSLYRPTSEIAALNAKAAQEPVRVSPPVFALLQHAQRLHTETGGAFDITIAPLVRCWGFMGGKGRLPQPDEIDEARDRVGMDFVRLSPEDFTVEFAREGVTLDLGAIGKGYAIDRAVEVLGDAGVTSALLHAGTSTVYALGQPPDTDAWKVSIDSPPAEVGNWAAEIPAVSLKDEAMSVSAVWGRSFESEGTLYGHVLDPRTGQPVNRAVLAAVVLPSATETDALSTALLILGSEGHNQLAALRPGMRALLVRQAEDKFSIEAKGIDIES